MYATLSDMQSRFEATELVQVTDQVGNGEIDVAFVEKAISDACSEIDSYVGVKYQVPVSPVPEVLKRYACDIARYNIWGLKGEMPKVVQSRYDAAIKFLKSISSGTAKLEAQGIDAAPTNSATIEANFPTRMFSRASLRGF